MTAAIIKDDRYMEHSAGDGHPESPNRLRVIHDLIEKEFKDLPLIRPRRASEDEISLVHDPGYIKTVAATSGKPFTMLDADTGVSARSFETAMLAAGGLLEAVDVLLNPTSSIRNPQSIFAFVRPPGHHAERGRGMGFCLFNNVAIAAEYARKKHGLKKILIIDWDLHHGNGTQRSFYDDPGVLFFSSHQYPHYPGTGNFDQVGAGRGEGFTVNAPFPAGFGDGEYIEVYDRILRPIAYEFQPELVLVSAGFDPYVKDPLGGMEITGNGFGALAGISLDIADKACGGRLLLTLEGGYNPEGLREGARSVLNTLLGRQRHTGETTPSADAASVINKIISIHRKYWKSLT